MPIPGSTNDTSAVDVHRPSVTLVFWLVSLLVATALFVGIRVLRADSQTADVVVHFDYRAYYSVEELSQASDIVVLGDVGRVVARQVDFGGSGPGTPTRASP